MKLVVWFPGLGSFANVTGNLLEYFEKDPDTDVLTLSYDGYGATGPSKAAQRLLGPLEELLEVYDRVYFIGHSMGGRVATYLISKHNLKPSKLVTVGTPNYPFRLTKHIPGDLFDEFSRPNPQTDTSTLHIFGEYDLLGRANPLHDRRIKRVLRADETTLIVPNHTHLSILWSSKAAAEIYSFCTYKD